MKIFITGFLVVLLAAVIYAGGGNGGPIGTIGIINDISSINNYISASPYNISEFDNSMIMWGGSGTSWLSRGFGLGLTVIGGYKMRFRDDYSAHAENYIALIDYNIENIFVETRRIQFGMRFGPGAIVDYLVMVNGANKDIFSVQQWIFHVGAAGQIKITQVTRMEIAVTYHVIPPTVWQHISGDATNVPDMLEMNCITLSIGVRFGSSYISSSSGGIYIQSPSSTPQEGILMGD